MTSRTRRLGGMDMPRRRSRRASIAPLSLRSLMILFWVLVPIGAILAVIAHFHMMSGEPIGLQGWLGGFRP